MKLTQIMNEGEEKRPLSNEVKKHFLEIVSTYNKYQESLDRKSDIQEIAETLGGITEAARTLAIHEGDDWFDKHTIKRNMSELEKLGKEFDKCAVEAKSLDQRLGGLYEDMGNILSRYYKMGDITEEQMKERLGMNESKSSCGCGCGGVTEGGCSTSVNEGILQDREKQLKNLKKGAKVSGGGYGPFKKISGDTFISPKGVNHNSMSLIKLIGSFSDFKVNESVNEEKPGLWANIRAKQARGEKPAHKNSQAHKDAVKAGEKINKEESVNETELKLGVKYTNKQGKEGFIQTGGSKNPKNWVWFDGKTKHPYDKVKKELKPSKDQKKTGFGDYLKQGGRVWDNVNPTNSPSLSEANFGYKDSTASYINNHKDEYKQAEKLNKGNEVKFYDTLSQMEDKIGHPKFMIFLSNALRGYKVDMYKDPKIKNPQDAQEALFLLSK